MIVVVVIAGFLLGGHFGNERFGGEQQGRDAGCILQRGADDLGRIDDSSGNQITVGIFVGVVSIWFSDPSRLATFLGLFSAGLAFALQRVVTALAAYVVLLRGKTFNVGERMGAYLIYQASGGHRVALLVFDPGDEALDASRRRMVMGREILFEGGPGISTALYRERGLGYAVTSDLDEDALAQLVQTSFH